MMVSFFSQILMGSLIMNYRSIQCQLSIKQFIFALRKIDITLFYKWSQLYIYKIQMEINFISKAIKYEDYLSSQSFPIKYKELDIYILLKNILKNFSITPPNISISETVCFFTQAKKQNKYRKALLVIPVYEFSNTP